MLLHNTLHDDGKLSTSFFMYFFHVARERSQAGAGTQQEGAEGEGEGGKTSRSCGHSSIPFLSRKGPLACLGTHVKNGFLLYAP